MAALKSEMDCAFDKGYRVIAGSVWRVPVSSLVDILTLVNRGSYAPALSDFMRSYGETRLDMPGADPYFEVKRP